MWAMVQDDLAVACAYSFLHEGDCGIYAVGTLRRWRRQGFARRLMEHVLADAQRRGARTASLQSTRMGEPLYASLRFDAVGRYEEWVPAATDPP
jgi:GNAT superfamily N-acetyltransferase